MKESSRSLQQSLVGCSIEFRFASGQNAVSVEQNIQAEKERIFHDVESALNSGGTLCVMLLAELTNYYRRRAFYMAVRSEIRMKRYRPSVLEYMSLPIQKRADMLYSVLSEDLRGDKDRDLKVMVAKYFLKTYPNRLVDFKKVLTREEFILVA